MIHILWIVTSIVIGVVYGFWTGLGVFVFSMIPLSPLLIYEEERW
jgi:multidrug transporter EmrE-like cation transporter